MRYHTDEQIEALIGEAKPLPEGWRSLLQPKAKPGHLEASLFITGVNRSRFQIITRQALEDPMAFSVILGFLPVAGARLFRLLRYNGKSHGHINHLEKNRFLGQFHVHMATYRYQLHGSSEDHFAEPSKAFYDLGSALTLLVNGNGFVRPQGELSQPEFF